jgi:hypothetical protein
MNLKKNFINDPENFEQSMEKIRDAGVPETFDKHFLIKNGFKDSVAVLYVNLFTSLELVDEEGRITNDYERLVSSDSEARMVIAEKVWQQYSELFAEDKQIYEKSTEKITDIFKRVYGDDHSETYLKLLASTFKTLVEYAKLQSGKKIAVLEEFSNENYLNGTTETDEEVDSETYLNEDSEPENSDSDSIESINDYSYSDEDLQETDNLINELIQSEIAPENEQPDPEMMTEENYVTDPQTEESETAPTTTKKVNSDNINEQLALILSKKVELLQKLNRPKEAITAIDMLIGFYDKSEREDRTEVLSKTLIRKSEILEEIGMEEEALSACDEFLDRFLESNN